MKKIIVMLTFTLLFGQIAFGGIVDVTSGEEMAVANDDMFLHAMFNQALIKLSEGEGVTIGLIIAAVLALVTILTFAYWNIRLRREIALRYETEKQLIYAKIEADEANQAKSMFLANISHEIRTPMNAIIGLGQLLEQTALTDKQEDYLNKINMSSNHLMEIINNLLDFSKIETGRLVVQSEAFELQDVIDEISDVVELRAKEKGLSFEIRKDESVPEYLIGDSLRLHQILINLVNNAIKFTNWGAIYLDISVVGAMGNKVELAFKVIDTGIGMTVEEKETLFAAFSQADITTTRKYGGTGLGLSIVKNLTTLMEGCITVDSNLDEGSVFEVVLPFELNLSAETNKKAFVVNTYQNLIGTRFLDNKHILLVEDNLINQQVAKENLIAEGARVTVANNGKEAIEQVSQLASLDLILMDLQMPVMDGVDATVALRQHYSSEILPIIALSADVQNRTFERIRAVDMQAHVAKPIDLSNLYHTIADVLEMDFSGMKPSALKPVPQNTDIQVTLSAFDVKSSLQRLSGNLDMYNKIAIQFADTYSGFATRLLDQENELSQEDYTREFHTLKGLAATLGHKEISAYAKALEQKFKTNMLSIDDLSTDSDFVAMTVLLSDAVDQINRYAQLLEVEEETCEIVQALDSKAFEEAFHALKEMLDSYDVEAQEKVRLLKANFHENGWSDQYTQIKSAVDAYDFEVALEIASQLIK